MTAYAPVARSGAVAADGWRLHLAGLGLSAAALLALFFRDTLAMVSIWLESSTFNHCVLIPPIIGWLVWQRLPELRQLAPRTSAAGLAIVAAGAFAWLLGEAAGLAVARHAGLIVMLQGAVVACLGTAVARGLAFPLFYALFMVPAGEELVAPLQTLTARISMVLLGLAGVPAHIEGVFISTPTGYFEVAEACSGVKFLVAMAAYGALVANVCFRAWRRRAAFMAAALLIPILANGVRAWGTIYVAWLSDNEFAVGFDHIVYGWVFFGIVIALIMAAGWRFFDRKVGDPWFDPRALQGEGTPSGSRRRLVRTAGAALLIAALAPFWTAAMASAGTSEAPADIALPAVPGWQRVPASSGLPWQPSFAGADIIRVGRYRNAAGQEADLAIAIFARQEEGRELVGYGQGAAGPDSGWAWTAPAAAPPSGRGERIASHGVQREVLSFFRVGDKLTGSPAAVKLETLKVRLLGGPQRAVAVLVSAQEPAEGISPRPALDAFLRGLGPIEGLADRAAGLPQVR